MPNQHGQKTIDASTAVSSFSDVKGLTRDRPWLLPSNRKLRHLQGISLRNLSLLLPTSRPRGKITDDESLPYALKTPAKLFAQRETPQLEHSKSSNDLKSPHSKLNVGAEEDASDSSTNAKARPANRKLRRRSTLNWTNAPPRVRQSKLEDVARERLADTWFSLHCAGLEEPVYVSEVVEKAMNPSFRFFDLTAYGPAVTRQDESMIKYWAKTENMLDYFLLIELQLNLRSLQFIGKSLESFHHSLPQNCVLFHLSDGVYTSFTDLPLDEPVLAPPSTSRKNHEVQSTSSFDTLMRLSNLDNCIQDALATRERLSSQISSLIREQKQSLDTLNASSQAEEKLAATNRSLAATRRSLKAIQNRRSELQASLKTRRTAMSSGNTSQQSSQSNLVSARADLVAYRIKWQESKTALTGQIRRVIEDISRIYPIEPIERKPLHFTIRGLHLPNAASLSSVEADSSVTAAAFGHVAHIVHLLSLYLLTPIPYPPSPHGSTSTVLDPISANMPSAAARTFPIYQKGAVAYRFDYGVFLLNSDIELLMSRQGLRMVDLRHTLPNLKYLLTVLTTGKGELPVRKKFVGKALGNGNASGGLEANEEPTIFEKGSQANGKLRELHISGGD